MQVQRKIKDDRKEEEDFSINNNNKLDQGWKCF